VISTKTAIVVPAALFVVFALLPPSENRVKSRFVIETNEDFSRSRIVGYLQGATRPFVKTTLGERVQIPAVEQEVQIHLWTKTHVHIYQFGSLPASVYTLRYVIRDKDQIPAFIAPDGTVVLPVKSDGVFGSPKPPIPEV
jgi:hypothetical protein